MPLTQSYSAHSWCAQLRCRLYTLAHSSSSCTTAALQSAGMVLRSALLKHGLHAGALDVMAQHGDKKSLDDDLMRDLTSAFRSILQAYKARATSCGQSYKHMVLLEAAVQGWHVSALLLVSSFSKRACTCGRGTKPLHRAIKNHRLM